MTYNSQYNKFASASFSGFIFEIYQISNDPILVKSYHDKFPAYSDDSRENINSIKHDKNNIIGFVDICSTNKYIYALYSGKRLNAYSNQEMLNSTSTNTILIFDWNGNCICKLESDIKLFNICVSANNKKLIALGWNDDYELFTFDLSNIEALEKSGC